MEFIKVNPDWFKNAKFEFTVNVEMKNGECIECGKPLFDQNKDETGQLCDQCLKEITEDFV